MQAQSGEGPWPPGTGGTIISVSLTMLVSLAVNAMTMYGVVARRKAWLIPFFILYLAFSIECLLGSIWTAARKQNVGQDYQRP